MQMGVGGPRRPKKGWHNLGTAANNGIITSNPKFKRRVFGLQGMDFSHQMSSSLIL